MKRGPQVWIPTGFHDRHPVEMKVELAMILNLCIYPSTYAALFSTQAPFDVSVYGVINPRKGSLPDARA